MEISEDACLWVSLYYQTLPALTCRISQLTFHCFMLANLHVVTGIPVTASILINLL